jgi:transposase
MIGIGQQQVIEVGGRFPSLSEHLAARIVPGVAEFYLRGINIPDKAGMGRLRRENARLREERDILKKAVAFFTKESK